MARHALRGMKKAKLRSVRRDMKTADKRKLQLKEKKQEKAAKEEHRKENPHLYQSADSAVAKRNAFITQLGASGGGNVGRTMSKTKTSEDYSAVGASATSASGRKVSFAATTDEVDGGDDAEQADSSNKGPESTKVELKDSERVWLSACQLSASAQGENFLARMTKRERRDFEIKIAKAKENYDRPEERVLLVGEGNFSFARALVTDPFGQKQKRGTDATSTTTSSNKNMGADKESISSAEVEEKQEDTTATTKQHQGRSRFLLATCYDDQKTLFTKYGADVKANIKALKAWTKAQEENHKVENPSCKGKGVEGDKNTTSTSTSASCNVYTVDTTTSTSPPRADVAVGVDCTQLSQIRDENLNNPGHWSQESWDKIVFQFPHSGSGEQDRRKNVEEHQRLLEAFFRECALVLNEQNKNAAVHVTIKNADAYKEWRIAGCCFKGSDGKLRVQGAYDFDPRVFPGYAHRRTIGFKDAVSAAENEEILKTGAKTYVFGWTDKKSMGAGRTTTSTANSGASIGAANSSTTCQENGPSTPATEEQHQNVEMNETRASSSSSAPPLTKSKKPDSPTGEKKNNNAKKTKKAVSKAGKKRQRKQKARNDSGSED
ncbi:unnamed protein product [Amoebophrya sp. A25]|nr:unnamed protein product [Amoebophrya sp. A25]|eukprot:GSA25T00010669001.1